MKISQIMTPAKNLITAQSGISLNQAYAIMQKTKKKILPLLDKNNKLAGLYVYSDVKRIVTGGSPLFNLAAPGNLRGGAALGVGSDALARAELLTERGV